MQAYYIASGKSLRKSQLNDIGRKFLLLFRSNGVQAHAERAKQVDDLMAYVSETDYGQILAVEFHQRFVPTAEITLPAPETITAQSAVVPDPVGNFQQMGHHHLRHCPRSVAGAVADRDAMTTGRRYINDIVAGCRHAYEPQLRKMGEMFLAKNRFVGNDYIRTGSTRQDIFFGGTFVKSQTTILSDCIPLQITWIKCVCV